jgi:hypothetical protein
VRLNWVLKNISATPDGLYKLDYDTPSGPATLRARSVAMTIPAWVLGDIIKDKVCGARIVCALEAHQAYRKQVQHAWAVSACTSAMFFLRKSASGSIFGRDISRCFLYLCVPLQAPSASAALASFDYPPVGAVTLAYPDSAIRDDRRAPDGSVPGFGQLHPRSQVRADSTTQ